MWLKGRRSDATSLTTPPTITNGDTFITAIYECEKLPRRILTVCKAEEPAQFLDFFNRRLGKLFRLTDAVRPNVLSYTSV